MLDQESQRQLGADISSVLDKYQVSGTNRILVLLAVIWAEGVKLQMGPATLAKTAIQAWTQHQSAHGFYRGPRG